LARTGTIKNTSTPDPTPTTPAVATDLILCHAYQPASRSDDRPVGNGLTVQQEPPVALS